MKTTQKARRRQLRRADTIKQTTSRIAQLEKTAAFARAELEHRVGLALASEPSHLAQPMYVRSSLSGVLSIAQQLTKARAQLKRLGGAEASS